MILKLAARRLEAGSLLGKAHLATIALGIIVLGALLIERTGAELFVPWRWVLPALVAAALIVTVRLWFAGRRSELEVAVEVDRRLELREKLSTALHCRDRTDAFARAAIEDAVGAARDPRTREMVRRHFAVASPRRWWLSPLAVVLVVGAFFIPPVDLFANDAEPDATVNEVVRERDEAIEAVMRPIERNPQLRDEMSDVLGELSEDGTDPEALKTRRDVQRDAVKKLTDINKRLDDILNGPKGKSAESVKSALEKLRSPEEGPARDLAEALAGGDFKGAREALEKMAAEARDGGLDAEKLAKQLDDLAAQLEQLAGQQKQIEDLLKDAGMNPQLAQNPQLLQRALRDNPNLNDQQKQQLQQMMQGRQAAAQMLQGLGQGLAQMGQGLGQGQMGQAGQQAAGQLAQMEALQQMLMEAQAAANAVQGQCEGLGQGLGMNQAMQQWMNGRGGAFGNRGQGAGGQAPITRTPTGRKVVKSPTKTTEGDIIARQFVDGPQIVGESKAAMRQVAEVVNRGYDEATVEEQLPRKYHEPHMHYFGELKRLVETVEIEDGGGEPDAEGEGSGAEE